MKTRFTLQLYKGKNSRHQCPGCGKQHEFTLYIDNSNLLPLDSTVGKCNRITNCGYHYTPKQFFADHPQSNNRPIYLHRGISRSPVPPKVPCPSTLDIELLYKSKSHYRQNHFVQWLKTLFGFKIAVEIANRYHIGTSKHWPGATVFWQMAADQRLRSGKIMLYDENTGRRVKEPFNHVTWVHRVLKVEEFELQQCLFGEHLLPLFPNLPVAIVESEKTAVVCSLFMTEFLWLATGGIGNLNSELFSSLKGREVILFPDLGAYQGWKNKASELKGMKAISVSDFLEKNAPADDLQGGFDLVDYFVMQCPSTGLALTGTGYPAFWDW